MAGKSRKKDQESAKRERAEWNAAGFLALLKVAEEYASKGDRKGMQEEMERVMGVIREGPDFAG